MAYHGFPTSFLSADRHHFSGDRVEAQIGIVSGRAPSGSILAIVSRAIADIGWL